MNKNITFNPNNPIVPECKHLLKDLTLFSEQIEAHYRSVRNTTTGAQGVIFASIIQTTLNTLLILFNQKSGEGFIEFREQLISFRNKYIL